VADRIVFTMIWPSGAELAVVPPLLVLLAPLTVDAPEVVPPLAVALPVPLDPGPPVPFNVVPPLALAFALPFASAVADVPFDDVPLPVPLAELPVPLAEPLDAVPDSELPAPPENPLD